MFDMECRKLLDNIHYFDVLRSDRSISSNGLEARTPFLDKTFVLHYFSIPAILRNPRSKFNMTSNIWDNLSEKFIHEGMNDIGEHPRAELRLKAAQTLLDRVGMGKQEKIDVEGKLLHGVVLMPAKKEMPTVSVED